MPTLAEAKARAAMSPRMAQLAQHFVTIRHPQSGQLVRVPRAAVNMGDPGLFSFLKGVVHTVGGVVGGLGIPVLSGIGQEVAALTGGSSAPPTPGEARAAGTVVPSVAGVGGAKGGSVTSLPYLGTMPDASAPPTDAAAASSGGIFGPGSPPGPGYHLNRTAYYRKGLLGTVSHVAKRSVWVKNRHRNPLNYRALVHSLHRAVGAKHAIGRIERIFSHLHSGHRRGGRGSRGRVEIVAGRGQKLLKA